MGSRCWSAAALAAFLIFAAASAEIPEGYYDPAAGLTGDALQEALHDIIDNHTSISYDNVWNAFYTTDDKPNGMVWDMYSDIPGGTPPYEYEFGDDQGGSASGEGEGYNREHSWPKSWFGGTVMPMYTDLFALIPSDIYVNNRRSNYPYGVVDWPTWTSMNGSKLGPNCVSGYVGTVFEPRDEYKGDLARGYFYMATRYLNEDASWPGSPMADGAQLLPWALGMLMDWHCADPVSQKELDRNEAIYAIQSNRNPFIDHPEYVGLVYDPTGVEDGSPVAMEPGLAISPNPFTSQLSITVSLARHQTVSLRLYDVAGRQVARPIDRQALAAGEHTFHWDGVSSAGDPLPAGVYLLRLDWSGGSLGAAVLRVNR